ncbi:uncharacterized protein LOC129717364 [Wyeomyia smithii]|uniref:uncharacterized protein LOC129717364 n=1 Tax=Wyeomyia smithii TaxID=174621 RepID=UPI002467D789|nr:uncharacterized protein LOC129717364 [Wyeomyia smithii]
MDPEEQQQREKKTGKCVRSLAANHDNGAASRNANAEQGQRKALALSTEPFKQRPPAKVANTDEQPGKYVRLLDLVHNSRAVISPVPTVKQRRAKLMEDLMIALEKNNTLRERSVDLSIDPSFDCVTETSRSTMSEDSGTPRSEMLLVTSLNNWTLSNLNIPECTPSDGATEIDKRAFDYWKDIFLTSIQMFNTCDEQTKFGLFKIKAGPKLRDIFNTTVSCHGMPDEATAPFSNAMERCNDYFSSRTNLIAQRSKLMSLCQSTSETSMQFVLRVSSAAKLCNYTAEEEMEAVVRVISKGALDSRVRISAHRNWAKQGSMKDLINLVRDRELEIANEEEYQRTHGNREVAKIAAVSQHTYEPPWRNQGNFRPNYNGYWRSEEEELVVPVGAVVVVSGAVEVLRFVLMGAIKDLSPLIIAGDVEVSSIFQTDVR